jgi:hypothetical protein
MWTKNDGDPSAQHSGGDTFRSQEVSYCRNLKLAGHSDWRLPTIGELQGIYDADVSVQGRLYEGSPVTLHVKGNLRLTGWAFSSLKEDTSGMEWFFDFHNGRRVDGTKVGVYIIRVLCVREP